MIEPSLILLPSSGFDSAWLKNIYSSHVANSRAVGKDGIKPSTFAAHIDEECSLITRKVNDGTFQFTNYREKLIARGAQRPPRQISVPTIRDRLVLRGALEFLKAHFYSSLPRPPHIYIKEIKENLLVARENSSFLRMDIRDFYPSLRHDLIVEILKRSEVPYFISDLILKAITTKTGASAQSAPIIGVPQGLSISNALAAIYMIEFDRSIEKETFYRRYVDDILIIESSEKIKSKYIEAISGLNRIGLKSHPIGTAGKTEIKRLGDGIQYLGYEIYPRKISIRSTSLAKMFLNLSRVITCFKYKKETKKHIFRLNLKITGCIINNTRRGWLMFFSQTDNISQISHLDAWLESEVQKFNINKSEIKKFKKSYYEIRYNLKNSRYIPNFDKYSTDEKKDILSMFRNKSLEEIDSMNIDSIEYEFSRIIGKEISELERDLIGAFS